MLILILSYFHPINGPEIYLKGPEDFDEEKIAFIPPLMDLDEQGFFSHEQEKIDTINFTFNIRRAGARGGYEMFMISLVLINELINPNIFKQVLKRFVAEFKEIEDVSMGINIRDDSDEEASKINEEIKTLFYGFYHDLPEETILIDRNARIMVFGLEGGGKHELIESLKDIMTNTKFYKGKITAKRLFFTNLTITLYDLPIKRRVGELWHHYVEQQDGFIFVIDESETLKFDEAKQELAAVSKNINDKSIPFLIIFNNSTSNESETQEKVKSLEINALNFQKVKVFTIKNKNPQDIFNCFGWIALKVLRRIFSERDLK